TWRGRYTTLEFLQYARDHNAIPLITANVFGGGYYDWSDPQNKGVPFVCQTVDPGGLAADWVRYTNIIIQKYRQGDEGRLAGENLRVYSSIDKWEGKPKLLARGEGAVPPVRYWEIGNEPGISSYENYFNNHRLRPTEYHDRYKQISTAMKAVDPSLKFGPCLQNPIDATRGIDWLIPLAADRDAQIDFVSYHPYYHTLQASWGHDDAMTNALRNCKAALTGKSARVRGVMDSNGRSNYDLVCSEWDPMCWNAPWHMQGSMANAIAVVETCFTFAEDGVKGGNFFEQPQNYYGVNDAFIGLVGDMGNVLVGTSQQMGYDYNNSNFRIYVSKNAGDDSKLMIWGLNFDNTRPVTVNLGLTPCRIVSATLKRYGKPCGGTTLTTNSGTVWSLKNVTAGFNPTNFPFTMQAAELTVLVLQIAPFAKNQPESQTDQSASDNLPLPSTTTWSGNRECTNVG
ncbi:MAG: GH39 family glycosyl hydrolase, partial [Planctomycetota bacterium]